MADIYQNIDGTSIGSKTWAEKKDSPEWTLKEYRNDKIWVRLHWIGRYRKDLPAEYRHSHGIQVYNRLIVKKTEWEEETLEDKGWVLDPAATQTFRTKSAAEAAYEDMLLRYTASSLEMDEDGEMTFVEVDNQLAPVVPGSSLILDEEQVARAAEKGIDAGGWS
ncbi:hypothetical protein CNR34_00100 [Pseudomonas phage nickie]|uniref:Uncharacterized protein n=1 Tax=Pseudomonas phage nickie TaxID=2048977 RepID=A0A2H4P759_9CAUD|nr:hypothetical protein FDJ16_gp065 [Pseudomonas phage nickie]ATW58033.1 hypothetical protein CNR34_00100 [Pseudomonas phage nickie]